MESDWDVCFEEGMLWLPAHVLNEAFEAKVHLSHQQQQHYRRRHHQHHHHHRLHSTVESVLQNSSLKTPGLAMHRRPRSSYPTNQSSGGPGMQAIFLDSGGQRTCGTGVFLPRSRPGNSFQPSKKPACSPVLLPSRVVQALNLNVHALNSKLILQREAHNNRKGETLNSVSTKKGSRNNKKVVDDSRIQTSRQCCCVVPQSRSSSPEIFLPKEWSY